MAYGAFPYGPCGSICLSLNKQPKNDYHGTLGGGGGMREKKTIKGTKKYGFQDVYLILTTSSLGLKAAWVRL